MSSPLKTLTINGKTFTITPVVPTSTVTLLASAWEGEGDKYSQVVEIPGVTSHTKVDLQLTSDQAVAFHPKVLGFVAENDCGVVEVFAIGCKPVNDHTLQVTLTEVEATGKIRGNFVSTTVPRSNWAQTDPAKADYIENKPSALGGASEYPEEPTFKIVTVGSVVLDAYGSDTESMLNFRGAHGDEKVTLGNVAEAEGDDQAVPLGQVWRMFREERATIVEAVLDRLPKWEGGAY